MADPPPHPPVADLAPAKPGLTDYDRAHLITYLRLLDAEKEGADWHEVARLVLGLDPDAQADRAERAWRSHLDRARWMRENGYQHLLRPSAPE